MIKHTLKDDLIHISIAKTDFSFRIPFKKIGNTIDWKIGEKGAEGIVIKGVSKWTLQLFTNKLTDVKHIREFISIVKEYCPSNTINWDDTLVALNIQNEYNWLTTKNNAAEKNIKENEIISNLKTKYKLA